MAGRDLKERVSARVLASYSTPLLTGGIGASLPLPHEARLFLHRPRTRQNPAQ